MGKISILDLENKMVKLLQSTGMNKEDIQKVTDIYMRASFRDVGHHDVASLFSRVKAINENKINKNPKIAKLSGFGGMECYDGDNGLGEICSYFITERSIQLSELHGIGFCSIRNSNHFLSAAPYAEIADEKGFFTIIMSKAPSGLSLPGADKVLMGNNPFGYAAGYENGKLLFDICCAYSSYGKMGQKAERGENVPAYWGNDLHGDPTTYPDKIVESGLFMPIGQHKGFGIALLIEILTSVFSDGAILHQDAEKTGLKGRYSQTAITIDISKTMDQSVFKNKLQQMMDILRELYPDISIPGERSLKKQMNIRQRGYFEIKDEILERIHKIP